MYHRAKPGGWQMLVLARRQGEILIIGVEILDADYDLTTFGEKEGFLGATKLS